MNGLFFVCYICFPMNSEIIIKDHDPYYQPGISDLLDGIQSEFSESIYGRNPPTNPIPVKLWLALHNDVVVGTVGIAALNNNNAALKSMMVQKEFRGADKGVSGMLLDTALKYALSIDVQQIYLGTMTQFKAAQHFYRKHFFTEIGREQLPGDFVCNPVDDVFFRLLLK